MKKDLGKYLEGKSREKTVKVGRKMLYLPKR
jgi:hypothetical protein